MSKRPANNHRPARSILEPLALAEQLFASSRHWKQVILLVLDACFISFAIWLAVIIRWNSISYTFATNDFATIAITLMLSIIVFLRIGLYRAIVRFMGQQAILSIIKGVTLSSLILAVVAFLLRSDMPRSVPLIYWAIALILIGGSRLLVRSLYQNLVLSTGERVIIYGAGASGRQLLTTLSINGEYRPSAFVDNNEQLVDSVVNGLSVYHPDQLPTLIDRFDIRYIFLALPSVAIGRRKAIIDQLESLPVYIKTVPSFDDLLAGTATIDQLLDIDLADLLGREVVPPDPQLIAQCIEDKTVMVTGAGGSIGLELCQQIIRCQPRELILFDISEYALYQAEKELRQQIAFQQLDCQVVSLLGTVQDEQQLTEIFKTFAVDTVYHAAAYKHVSMVENNIAAGVRNNVFGTLASGRAATTAGVETFVLVSTDKAVRPAGVMGASKRLAELVLQALAQKYPNTRYCTVRFGNVLGSSGSVVPLFRQQIRDGGPVTVTHKEASRFFMTISEAAQLVLQAGALAKGGDVFVLDMGEPVKILDIAKHMIRLTGANVSMATGVSTHHTTPPNGSIPIHFCGLRPGEKLHEELVLGNNITGTTHPKIMQAEEELLSEAVIDKYLSQLEQACTRNDCIAIYHILLDAVSGFNASDGVSDSVWLRRKRENDENNKDSIDDNVVELKSLLG